MFRFCVLEHKLIAKIHITSPAADGGNCATVTGKGRVRLKRRAYEKISILKKHNSSTNNARVTGGYLVHTIYL